MARELKCKVCGNKLGEVCNIPNANFNSGCHPDAKERYKEMVYWDETTTLFGDSEKVTKVVCARCNTKHCVYSTSLKSHIIRRITKR